MQLADQRVAQLQKAVHLAAELAGCRMGMQTVDHLCNQSGGPCVSRL